MNQLVARRPAHQVPDRDAAGCSLPGRRDHDGSAEVGVTENSHRARARQGKQHDGEQVFWGRKGHLDSPQPAEACLQKLADCHDHVWLPCHRCRRRDRRRGWHGIPSRIGVVNSEMRRLMYLVELFASQELSKLRRNDVRPTATADDIRRMRPPTCQTMVSEKPPPLMTDEKPMSPVTIRRVTSTREGNRCQRPSDHTWTATFERSSGFSTASGLKGRETLTGRLN